MRDGRVFCGSAEGYGETVSAPLARDCSKLRGRHWPRLMRSVPGVPGGSRVLEVLTNQNRNKEKRAFLLKRTL